MLNSDHDVPLLVRRPDGEETWHDVRADQRSAKPTKRPMIGIGAAQQAARSNIFPEVAGSPESARRRRRLKDYDKSSIEAGGQKVASGDRSDDDLRPAADWARSTLKIERPRAKTTQKRRWRVEASARDRSRSSQPRPMRELGLTMKIGPIVAIREDSPACEAGFQVGDQIVEVNGQPVGDPLSLSQRLTPKLGQPRARSRLSSAAPTSAAKPTRKTLTVAPEPPLQSMPTACCTNPDFDRIDRRGLRRDSARSPRSSRQPRREGRPDAGRRDHAARVYCRERGDKQVRRSECSEDAQADRASRRSTCQGRLAARGHRAIADVVYPDTKVKLTWTRGGKGNVRRCWPRDSTTFFDDARDCAVCTYEIQHTAAELGREAFRLGFRETKRPVDASRADPARLVTGRLSPTNLSGPAGNHLRRRQLCVTKGCRRC